MAAGMTVLHGTFFSVNNATWYMGPQWQAPGQLNKIIHTKRLLKIIKMLKKFNGELIA
jgi:hypothetical protein